MLIIWPATIATLITYNGYYDSLRGLLLHSVYIKGFKVTPDFHFYPVISCFMRIASVIQRFYYSFNFSNIHAYTSTYAYELNIG